MMQMRIGLMISLMTVVWSSAPLWAAPMSTAFTYQGQLKKNGAPMNGTVDIRATLWDAVSAGAQVGSAVDALGVAVSNGLISLPMDFGVTNFNGEARWLQIELRSPAGSGIYTTLSARQPLTAVPYALQARGIFVDDAGNVGIGTDAPVTPLHLRPPRAGVPQIQIGPPTGGSVTRYMLIHAQGMDVKDATGEATLRLNTSPGADVSLCSASQGNVGIGTTSPQTKLHVVGDIRGQEIMALGSITAVGDMSCLAMNITSDKNAKEDFVSVDPGEILARVVDMPISRWQFKAHPGVRHIGPMAQDFHGAFSVGRDEKHISSVDSDGVALAAIQGLHAIVEEKDAQIISLDAKVISLQAQLAELTRRMNRLDGNRVVGVKDLASRN